LAARGCRLLEVDDGKEALRMAHAENPAIAIVDLLTPKLDRGEFVRELRSHPATARMPVIFYTDGYLEIASGTARDVDTLLTPMLLCEEATRGKIIAHQNGPVVSANGQNGSENLQEVFTFACEFGGERALIRPGDLIAEIVEDARKSFPKAIEITSAYSENLWLIEVLRRLKNDPRTRAIPIVVLTSSREEKDLLESYQLGVNSYIVKPVDFDQFSECLRDIGMYWLLSNTPPKTYAPQ
jgi:CheY-like chemotaxis protein